MMRVVGCLVYNHDLRLVAVGAALCALACYTALHMLSRAAASGGRVRLGWLAAAAIVFGTGVWATHFVAMLGFEPSIPFDFAVDTTAASLGLAIAFSFAGFAALLGALPGAAALLGGGVTIAAGIGVMHYTGMAALRLPGLLHYELVTVAAALLVGLLFAVAAAASFRVGRRLAAAALLWLSVCGLHFTSMAAVWIEPIWLDATPVAAPVGLLAVAVSAGGLLIIAVSLAGSMLDQRLAARAMQEGERFRQFADSTFEGILFETGGIITDANAVFGGMVGREPKDFVGRELAAVFSADTVDLLAPIEVAGGTTPAEGELIRADASRLPVEILRRVISGPAGSRAVLAVRDISERLEAQRRIRQLAHYDPLTGLANRLLFQDRLSTALALAQRSGQGVVLLCLDLDRFKAANDLLGHPAGDKLLAEAAARLAGSVREMDTPARLGGDEFAVIQPLNADPDAAAALASRLVMELSRPYEWEGQSVTLGTSIGIAIFPQDGATAEALMQNADLALYRAKQDGGGAFRFFKPEMDWRLQQRRELERDLREAAARGEMEVHYQPLFASETLDLVGYEALLRWTHPKRGAVSPDQFIPVAEECGAIGPLGRWVLDMACAEAASWPRPLRIAVNLSPVQFRQADLAGMVATILHKHRLDPARLELEITEGVLIDDGERALAVLRRLKALGVRIALDDFGTGYSSLSYLRRFPFDKIKIDKSFIHGLGEDHDAEAIVSSIIAMSHSLRLDVTAEGVETEGQLLRLRSEHCSQVQGFLLGRPHAADRLHHRTHSPAERETPMAATLP
ncbi:MAG: EAL domain-containing protein [Alphaproteobacteria bacterium]|nr:EAL domain-containing protein [Alphaproteobacteria bacterium]